MLGGHAAYGCIVRTTAEVLLAPLPHWHFSREPDAATGWAELVVLDGAGWWALFKGLLGPFLVGAAVAIPTLAGLSYLFVHALVRRWQGRKAAPAG